VAAVEVIDRYVGAVRRGDWTAAYSFFADDVVGHVPGRSALAGELRGREAAIAYVEAARAKSPAPRSRSS
jgi:ketosteroid isomerase-like protein